MERTKWVDRKFSFDFPPGILPSIVERLIGTPTRIREIVKQLPAQVLEAKPGGKWSIKENIGHLCDLEDLHEGRIDDFIAHRETLRAADMDNIKTKMAGHNNKNLEDLLDEFIGKRNNFITRLKKLDDDTHHFQSMHPRLKILMRPVDMAYFTCEHDDHHLASMRELLN